MRCGSYRIGHRVEVLDAKVRDEACPSCDGPTARISYATLRIRPGTKREELMSTETVNACQDEVDCRWFEVVAA